MKRLFSLAGILGLSGLALCLPAQPVPFPQNQAGSAQHQQQMNDAQSARAFEGKIAKAGGKLVLQESSTGQAYLLDDQDKPKHYLGENVKVIATIDPNTNILHVVDITPADTDKDKSK